MIRFVCKDGIGYGTQMFNAETGEDISKILAVSYGAQITIGELVEAKAQLAMVGIDITAHRTVWETKHPLSNEYLPLAAIEFRDGVRVEFAEDGTPSVAVPK